MPDTYKILDAVEIAKKVTRLEARRPRHDAHTPTPSVAPPKA